MDSHGPAHKHLRGLDWVVIAAAITVVASIFGLGKWYLDTTLSNAQRGLENKIERRLSERMFESRMRIRDDQDAIRSSQIDRIRDIDLPEIRAKINGIAAKTDRMEEDIKEILFGRRNFRHDKTRELTGASHETN